MAKPPAIATRSVSFRLLLGAAVVLFLAGACGLASAASSKATSRALSAQLTKTRFTSSQAGSVKLIYRFSKPSKSFSYRLTFKKGSKWVLVKRVKKRGSFSGKKTTTVKKLFAGRSVRVGSHKLKLASDGGSKTLSFKVIKAAKPATKPSGGGTTTTPTGTTPTGSAPSNTSLPAISGTVRQDETLSASNGAWNNSPTSFGYQWERCSASCSAISGATANTYVLAAADVKMRIRISVAATNSYGSATAVSSQTATVVGFPPANTALPVITGTPETTKTLHASTGTWSNSPTYFGYQWLSCDKEGDDCSEIPGATSSDYTINVDDLDWTVLVTDWTVRVTVTATNDYGSLTAYSAQSEAKAITPGGQVPVNVNKPVITGEARVGLPLQAITGPGDWNYSPTFYIYRWYACDECGSSSVYFGREASYTPDADDVGLRIHVDVYAFNEYGYGIARSELTDVVAGATP